MPIRPESKSRYPADWPEIRARILARAENRCERCGKPNGEWVSVLPGGYWWGWNDPMGWRNSAGRYVGDGYSGPDAEREIRVVLTIAHLDHTPEHNDPENLQSLCQSCHLRLDRDLHTANAAETRRRKWAARQPALAGLDQ